MDKKKKAAIKKQEDEALSRALSWFAGAMVLEFLLLLVNKYYIGFIADSTGIALALALDKVLRVTAVLGLVGGIIAGWWCYKASAKQGKLAFGQMLLCAGLLAVGVSSVLIVLFYAAAVQLLCLVVPAVAVLALVYYLYQKEFFLSALCSGAALLGLWLVRKNHGTHDMVVYLYAALCVVALLAVVCVAVALKKGGNGLKLCGKTCVLSGKKLDWSVAVSALIGILAVIAGVLLGATAAFYLMVGLVAWLFVLLVYYTVKLM